MLLGFPSFDYIPLALEDKEGYECIYILFESINLIYKRVYKNGDYC
jgi:hypothetical protein